MKTFLKKHRLNGYLIAGIILTTVIVLWIVVGRFYTPYNPTKMSSAKLQAPSPSHLFGTDKFGKRAIKYGWVQKVYGLFNKMRKQ